MDFLLLCYPYEYHPLKDGNIRILELFPGAPTDLISCSLVETPIEDAGNFEAVSYTWGTEDPSCPIQIDGGSFQIRPSLEAALVEFRAGCNDIRRLWIDAICIYLDRHQTECR